MRLSAVVAASAAILLGAGSALAQLADVDGVETEAGTAGPGRSNAIIGLGVGLTPDYEGSDHYEVGVVPFGRFSYKEYQQYLKLGPNFGSRTYQARLNVMPYEGFELGPMLTYRPGRKSVENNKVDRLPNTDNAAEAGGFTRYWLPLALPGSQSVAVDLSGAADVSSAYDGWWIQPGLDYKAGLSETVGFSARLLRLCQRQLYGRVLQHQLEPVRAQWPAPIQCGCRLERRGPVARRKLAVCRELVHRSGCHYARLLGDAGDSPVVRSAGSRNQAAGGVFVGYKF